MLSLLKIKSFKNVLTGHVYVIGDNTYCSVHSKIQYTLREAMKAPELIINEYLIVEI